MESVTSPWEMDSGDGAELGGASGVGPAPTAASSPGGSSRNTTPMGAEERGIEHLRSLPGINVGEDTAAAKKKRRLPKLHLSRKRKDSVKE